MKHSEAVETLRQLMFVVQKTRSNQSEFMQKRDDGVEILEELQPWIHGKKSILPGLEKVMNRVDDGGMIEPQEFYNFMYIVDRFAPQLNMIAAILKQSEFPIPDAQWMRGWSPE